MRACLIVAFLMVGLTASLLAQNRPGEVNTPPARGERKPDTLKVGDLAPDFTLPDLAGKNTVPRPGRKKYRDVIQLSR
ncbi:hypothetical protein HRbin36_02713 [bacterium HR36]|nr:hypothetical protein HRbin36_02713 [bacterium HR36]